MSLIRRCFLVGGACFAVAIGCSLGIVFMMHVIEVFNSAIEVAGRDPVNLIINLAHGIKGILAWIVFGITMTNALVIASAISVPLLVGQSAPKS